MGGAYGGGSYNCLLEGFVFCIDYKTRIIII